MDKKELNNEKENKLSFLGYLRRYFFAGIAALLPVIVTIFIIRIVFRFTDKFAGKYINEYLLNNYGYSIPGLGFIATVLFFMIIGLISSHFIGRKVIPFFEKLFIKIPVVASIYPSLKRLSDFLFGSDQKHKFKKVVLVPYPSPKSYSLGFVTNEELGNLEGKIDDELVTAFVPIAPTPFSGFILFVPKKEIKFLNISVDLAIRCIVSGGVIPPVRE
ncbi:MAG: DUF502 domain-containing protein [Candidatus Omnitrophica bacterium]|nr:DUF502 domain-containing protein [Candidatus Omnitrophota bacterium]MCF7876788.1 DUF502 domain-containing protein [Candidatus Omnitrophota bacterium]MCF7878234.1 DUF502 domain-containing protein [Candidatus Omnitrophota bacterium]